MNGREKCADEFIAHKWPKFIGFESIMKKNIGKFYIFLLQDDVQRRSQNLKEVPQNFT